MDARVSRARESTAAFLSGRLRQSDCAKHVKHSRTHTHCASRNSAMLYHFCEWNSSLPCPACSHSRQHFQSAKLLDGAHAVGQRKQEQVIERCALGGDGFDQLVGDHAAKHSIHCRHVFCGHNGGVRGQRPSAGLAASGSSRAALLSGRHAAARTCCCSVGLDHVIVHGRAVQPVRDTQLLLELQQRWRVGCGCAALLRLFQLSAHCGRPPCVKSARCQGEWNCNSRPPD